MFSSFRCCGLATKIEHSKLVAKVLENSRGSREKGVVRQASLLSKTSDQHKATQIHNELYHL